MNTDVRKKLKTDFEKDFFNLKDYGVSGKALSQIIILQRFLTKKNADSYSGRSSISFLWNVKQAKKRLKYIFTQSNNLCLFPCGL